MVVSMAEWTAAQRRGDCDVVGGRCVSLLLFGSIVLLFSFCVHFVRVGFVYANHVNGEYNMF